MQEQIKGIMGLDSDYEKKLKQVGGKLSGQLKIDAAEKKEAGVKILGKRFGLDNFKDKSRSEY